MRMYDIIKKKRDGGELSSEEIKFFAHGYAEGKIPDEQISALLMAIYFNGMNFRETSDLTSAITTSGDVVDLSGIEGIKVDKHSTGGVGDKTTLIIAPLVAACGVKVAKMSGRGLGHTGGTIDKLEAIPGFQTSLERQRFFDVVNSVGVSVIGQSGHMAPADKKLYALRDVTATVDNQSLIASSIMGKKLASGADGIVLDVKTGSGSFNKTVEIAQDLAKVMVDLGKAAGKKMVAIITDMDIPLGCAIGNSLEVIEAVDTLKGHGPADLTEVCLELAANMLFVGEKGSIEECRKMAKEALNSGAGFNTLVEMVKAQGGDPAVILDTDKFEKAKILREVKAENDGYIAQIDTEGYGLAALVLGAGRNRKEDKIDFTVGIKAFKKTGDFVKKGETFATIYANSEDAAAESERRIRESTEFSPKKPQQRPLILGRVE